MRYVLKIDIAFCKTPAPLHYKDNDKLYTLEFLNIYSKYTHICKIWNTNLMLGRLLKIWQKKGQNLT